MSAVAALLAHQGGWDEMIVVAIPIALFAGLLALANRRANQAQDERERADVPDEEPDADTSDAG